MPKFHGGNHAWAQVPIGNCVCKGFANEWIAWHWTQQLSGLVWLWWQVRKGPCNCRWAVSMIAVSVAIEEMMPHCWAWTGEATPYAEGRGPISGLCWCLVSSTWGTGMFIRPRSESEREQKLGKRTRPFSILSRTKRILLDDGCKGRPLPCAVDQELDRGEARHRLTSSGISWNGRDNLPRSN